MVDAGSEPEIVFGVAPREWEVLFDESRFLDPEDLVSFRPPASMITSKSVYGRRIFVLSRNATILPPVPAGYVLRPLSVPVTPYGYALVEEARGLRLKMAVTWLWQLVPCRKRGSLDCR